MAGTSSDFAGTIVNRAGWRVRWRKHEGGRDEHHENGHCGRCGRTDGLDRTCSDGKDIAAGVRDYGGQLRFVGIRSSELAMQKSQTAAIQEFAQMMINDHTKASKDLMAAAQKDGVTVPAEMTKKHASKVEALKTADNEAFDEAYIDAQVAAHREALPLMSSYAESGDAAALKAHAQKTAPIVQRHFEHAQQLDKAK
ncbi:MAG: DUF4142 domain-containing protein [Mesorhizobium sp.]|nr:MAG: DUF4142 domain-containing protein [Mesorhizobium sp.]